MIAIKTLFNKDHAFFALILFILISSVFFGRNVVFHLNTRFVGDGADSTIYIWSFAWVAHTLFAHQSLFYSNAVFHPTGINLTHVTITQALSIIFLPITLLFGPIVSYNLCAIFAPGLSAWTAYLLNRAITQAPWFSLIGGFFYGFSCYITAQSLGHLNLVVPAIFIPLLILLIIKKSNQAITTTKFITLFSLLLILIFYTSIEILATFTA